MWMPIAGSKMWKWTVPKGAGTRVEPLATSGVIKETFQKKVTVTLVGDMIADIVMIERGATRGTRAGAPAPLRLEMAGHDNPSQRTLGLTGGTRGVAIAGRGPGATIMENTAAVEAATGKPHGWMSATKDTVDTILMDFAELPGQMDET